MTLKLSPSSINLFIEEPALWLLKHFKGLRSDSNIYAIRGKLVETFINMKLDGKEEPSFHSWLQEVLPSVFFDNVTFNEYDLKGFYKWGQLCYKNYLDNTKEFGTLVTRQREVSGIVDGILLAGFIDFEFEDTIVDLKTANKVPSLLVRGDRKGQLPAFKAANIRQQAVYAMLSGKKVALLFANEAGESLLYKVTDKDIEEITPSILDTIKKIKKCLDNGFERSIIEHIPKNINSMYWDDNLINEAKKLWLI